MFSKNDGTKVYIYKRAWPKKSNFTSLALLPISKKETTKIPAKKCTGQAALR